MKILILGPSSGGKSELARKIEQEFNIPRLEVDRLWFKFGGENFINGCTAEQKKEIVDKILNEVTGSITENEHWVIEGTTMNVVSVIAEQADDVVVIGRPLLMRIWSHVWRVIKGENRHAELTRVQDLLFVKTMVRRWWKGENKRIQNVVGKYQSKLVVLKSFRQIDRYFEQLKGVKK